jgi:hypothetical protein
MKLSRADLIKNAKLRASQNRDFIKNVSLQTIQNLPREQINPTYIIHAIGTNRPDIFAYLFKYENEEIKNLNYILGEAFKKIDFFKSLVIDYHLDLLMKDGFMLTLAAERKQPKILKFMIDYLRSQNLVTDLSSEADIARLSDMYVTQAKDVFVYPIGYVYDPIMMIRYGFFPTSVDIDKPLIDYINGMDIPTLKFWHLERDVKLLLALNNEPRWSYSTLETHKRNGVTLAISLPLMLYAPEFVYHQSKRPVNDMALFRSPVSNKVRRSDIINNTVLLDNVEWKVIPVTRYTAGMRRGLFLGETNINEFCGTFYYYEPESTTLLAHQTSASYFNKYIAVQALNGDPSILEQFTGNLKFMKYSNGELPQDAMLTPDQYNAFLLDVNSEYEKLAMTGSLTETQDSYYNPSMQYKDTKGVSPNPYYIGGEFYAIEDDLDQPLCELGKANNLEIIILESMPGKYQVVTEILDTRKREDSVRSLIYIVD